ncbi:MAG: hypothetical protein H0X17_02420 [Deltaproteobacteria bacterium]|nr:hypothetical protein [Deltaproteobacteria bacterium]
MVLAAGAGCREPDNESSLQPSGRPASHAESRDATAASLDAALPRLAPDREAFWARYLGEPGIPGPDMLTYCRDAKVNEIIDIGPGATLEKSSADWCQVVVQDRAMIEEARTILRRWTQRDKARFLDPEHELSTFVFGGPERTVVGWRTYVPLEKIFATDGRLLVGFDAKRVLGKSALALRAAVSSPYRVKYGCEKNGCAAYGPSPPGGAPVRIGFLPNASPDIQVTLWTMPDLLPRMHTLLAASLGRGRQEGPSTIHVYRRDGIRYWVDDGKDGNVLIKVSTD